MNKLRIIPLGGGPGMVTNNMYLYEYGNDVLIVDCGIGFINDEASEDILVPDISYLKNNPRNILGIVISHGHDDHIAALPHILPELNFPPVYASKLAKGFSEDRLKGFNLNIKVNLLKETDQLRLGPFTINPIHVTHSVPDTYHFMISTPVGLVYHGSDFKFDLTPVDNWPPNFKKITKLSQPGVLCMLSDCLRSERKGFNRSESTISSAFNREVSKVQGRLIFTTMSSQIHRIQQMVDVATSYGRKIAFIGRSMETNTMTAQSLGFLRLPKKYLIDKKKINKVPDHQLCLIVAGSQGQESSSLTRYASETHRVLKPKKTDTVVYSADIIPGNEQPVFDVVDQMSQLGIKVVYEGNAGDLHVSGHAKAGELQLLMELVGAHYLYPIGGTHRHIRAYEDLALQSGYNQNQVIVPQAGQVVELTHDGHYQLGETLKLIEVRVNQDKTRSFKKSSR